MRSSVHFIVPAEFVNEASVLDDRLVGHDFPYWAGGSFNWAALSYLILRQHRDGMTVGVTPQSRRVNFAHVKTWRALGARCGEYRVSARADYRRLFDVDFEILQNPAVPVGRSQAYLPYWPVPGIKRRDSARQGVKTVAYAGRIGPLNLTDGLRRASDLWERYSFRIIPPDRWHDMSEIDILIAIRSFDRKPHHTKPPSKLFAAWLANVPLIAGWDSAFSAIATPGRDYLRVEDANGLRAALDRLASDQAHYDAIVAAGRTHAPDISHESIAAQWIKTFEGPIAEAFAKWREPGLRPIARTLDRSRNLARSLRRAIEVTSKRADA